MLKVVAFLRAVREFVADGCVTVSPEAYAERLTICQPCEHRNGMNCRKCGCGLARKAKWRSSLCPDDRWPTLVQP